LQVQSTQTLETRYRSVSALLAPATFMQTAGRRLRGVAMGLHAWVERRRVAAAAFADFGTMGERELQDIGLTRSDLHRAAWGAAVRHQD
jgi:uncharacterized protein YjiS (DUF1127 family)